MSLDLFLPICLNGTHATDYECSSDDHNECTRETGDDNFRKGPESRPRADWSEH